MVLPLGDYQRTRIVPIATYVIIAMNIAVFLIQEDRGEQFTMAFAATPWEITHNEDVDETVNLPRTVQIPDRFGRPARVVQQQVKIEHVASPIPVRWTILTAMFLHGGWMHLIGNMLYLWIVGDNVEEVLGTFRYIIVYLACGVMASVAQIAVNPNSIIPTLGASGAIAGIMGAYVVWFPHNQIRVLVFRFITDLPAVLVIGGWIILQIWSGAGSLGEAGESGGVAYLAHVGGALTGVFVGFLFYDRARYIRSLDAASGWRAHPHDSY